MANSAESTSCNANVGGRHGEPFSTKLPALCVKSLVSAFCICFISPNVLCKNSFSMISNSSYLKCRVKIYPTLDRVEKAAIAVAWGSHEGWIKLQH